MVDNLVRVEFLKKSHLFLGLSDAELAATAEAFQDETFDSAGVIYSQGDTAESLVIIFEGRVNLTRKVADKEIKLASMVKGDYFGERGLLKNKKRIATATAESGTTILTLHQKSFLSLLKKAPGLRQNMETMISSRQLARKLNYDWLAENEVIYFLARKHQFLLIYAVLPSVGLLLPILPLLALAYIFGSTTFGLVGGILLGLDIVWGAWRVLDWGNDYYIVTNQRVIWLEKVIGFYDSRTEASMATILSVKTETDFFGRMYEYGTVIVRTYTGEIRMIYVPHPSQAAAMINEHLGRTKDTAKKATEESMKRAIRAKLGMAKPELPPPPAAEQAKPAKPAAPVKKSSFLESLWQNAFPMRIDDGNTITYHKHIFGFFRDAAPYVLGILVLVFGIVAWSILENSTPQLWLGTLVTFGVLVLLGCIGYIYVDWQNDIYQVTPEQIIDTSRKPFGDEDRRVAALENILSTEYKRNGFFGIIFNFGTVYTMVGSEEYNFEDVADPPSVQQDIIRRQQGRLAKKREADSAGERERMTDWLAMYHRTMEDIKREKEQSGSSDSE